MDFSVDRNQCCGCEKCCEHEQRHVHEILGSVEVALDDCEPHCHRFATVSDEAIPCGGDHVHEVCFRTDFSEDHFHEFRGTTGGAIDVGCGRHVHFLQARTEPEDGHSHCFRVATLIDNPTGDNR